MMFLSQWVRTSSRWTQAIGVGTTPLIAIASVCGLAVVCGLHAAEPSANNVEARIPKIFDGKSLDGWRVIDQFDFRDHGKVHVQDGVIYLEKGKPATGMSWAGEFPKSNYEVSFSGQRVEGNDFFCGLTFPVQDEYCTLILGGWGGSVVGLSNIDGFSAIENNTTQAVEFEQGRWYAVRLTVLDARITVSIDDKTLIDVPTEGHKFSIWWEQEPVTPLGIVTWHTSGAIKNLDVHQPTARSN